MSQRLRERKVVQWAFAYLAGAWVLLQVLGQVSGSFGWAPVVMRVVTVALAYGIIPAIVLAWFHGERGQQRISATEMAILLVVLIGGSILVWRVSVHASSGDGSGRSESGNIPSKSVAILPFTTFTHDAETDAFAAGLQDEILTVLSGVTDLKLISRTSVQQYASTTKTARTIGRELGVRTLLEGSVQRAGDRIQVQAQFIDAINDGHIWSQTFTGSLGDVFKIQSDIAQSIALSLQSHLTSKEKERLTVAPTKNKDAYAAYVSGRQYQVRGGEQNVREMAVRLFRRATELDPQFALAYARLSIALGDEYWFADVAAQDPAMQAASRAAAERALELAPTLPEAHAALGRADYHGQLDYDGALRELGIARAGLPNSAELHRMTSAVERRAGHWREAETSSAKSAELDPMNAVAWTELCITQSGNAHYDAAAASCRRSLDLAPDSYTAASFLGPIELERTGRLDEWNKLTTDAVFAHSTDPVLALQQFVVAYYARDAKRAFATLSTAPRVYATQIEFTPRSLASGWVHALAHDDAGALAAFDSARAIADSAVLSAPAVPAFHLALGYALAGLGRKQDAAREARMGAALLSPEKDALVGVSYTRRAAQILAQAGFTDDALAMLEHIAAMPSGSTPVTLRFDPGWDSLRREPRFKALLERKP